MSFIFGALYILFILCVVLVSFFIVTRLQAYSINPSFTRPLIIIFILVTIFLVLVNVILFFMIPFSTKSPGASPYYSTNINY